VRRLVVVAVCCALLVAAVLVGGWEGDRFRDEMRAGIASVRAVVGPLDNPALTHYRLQDGLTCLVYGRDGNELALELCFDAAGRAVEAVDRRGADVERWSLRPEPDAASIRVDPAQVDRLRTRLYDGALEEAERREAGEG
jgi:hypothetical protein